MLLLRNELELDARMARGGVGAVYAGVCRSSASGRCIHSPRLPRLPKLVTEPKLPRRSSRDDEEEEDAISSIRLLAMAITSAGDNKKIDCTSFSKADSTVM